MGSSLAPATDQSLSAGAWCASSLPAGAAVVTTRLAQNCCRFARAALQQGSHWLAPLRLVGLKMPRVCHTRHAWRRRLWPHTVVAAWGSGAGLYPARMRAKPDCGRAAFALDCGVTVAGARRQEAVQTIDYRLTRISEPCGCRCRGDQSGSCARSCEHRAMRLRASSGLTQPAWKPIRCQAIRCTMAIDIRRTARIVRLAVETIARLHKFRKKQRMVCARSSLVIRLGWVKLWGRECQQCYPTTRMCRSPSAVAKKLDRVLCAGRSCGQLCRNIGKKVFHDIAPDDLPKP